MFSWSEVIGLSKTPKFILFTQCNNIKKYILLEKPNTQAQKGSSIKIYIHMHT